MSRFKVHHKADRNEFLSAYSGTLCDFEPVERFEARSDVIVFRCFCARFQE